MRQLVVVLLLMTAAAHAQSVSPLEQNWGPYQRPQEGFATAGAASARATLLAWSAVDPDSRRARVHTMLLSLDGRRVSPPAMLPAFNPTVSALDPVVVSNGESFFVVWTEGEFPVGVAIDARGRAQGVPERFERLGFGRKPVVYWDGRMWQVSGGQSPDVAVSSAGSLFLLDWANVPVCFVLCGGLGPRFQIDWMLYTAGGSARGRVMESYVGKIPSAGGGGDQYLMVWESPRGLSATRVRNGETGSIMRLDGEIEQDTRAQVAFDGTHYLIVFENNGDVFGALVGATNFIEKPFPIAVSVRAEQRPGVVAVAPGHFLVHYNTQLFQEDHRVAWRAVTTSPPRRRSVR